MGRGMGARSEDKLQLPTTAGNFNFWLFGDRYVQGDEWMIQTRCLRYIQAFWGWIGGEIFSWQLCCIFFILTKTKSRVGSLSCLFRELIVDNKKITRMSKSSSPE